MEAATLKLWLTLAHQLSARNACALLRDNPDPAAAVDSANRRGDNGKIAQVDDKLADQVLTWLKKPNHHLLTWNDPAYPALLREIQDAPPVLYLAGDPDVIDTLQLAMVGSRSATAAGARTANEFAQYLAASGLSINSGLALGIDAASHRGALAVDGLTIAVAGTGLMQVYPREHRELAAEIADRGALVSELPLDAPPRKAHFPQRNRIISGLSAGVLVVEAAVHSGSLITARTAGEQGREVFAIPGSIHNPQARGCNALIRQGAKLVETAAHVLEELSPYISARLGESPAHSETLHSEQNTEPDALDADYRQILEAVDFAPTSIDQVIMRTSRDTAEVASMLLMLELRGHVESLSGGHYQRVGAGTTQA